MRDYLLLRRVKLAVLLSVLLLFLRNGFQQKKSLFGHVDEVCGKKK